MREYQVRWSDEEVAALLAKVRSYRHPKTPQGDRWQYGCDPDFLKSLCAYWIDGFDWRRAVAELNRYPQILVSVEGLDLHAVHVVGEAAGRRPLLLSHGWPGSIHEFWEVIEPLAFPSRHGGRAEDAFDLVIPSLPGFGFSAKPPAPLGARTTARLFDGLMQALGYTRYLAQGGDWGAGISAWLALEHAPSVRAIHLNFMLVQPQAAPQTDEERAWQKARDAAQGALGAYVTVQATKPLSLAYAMADNPVAQAAWIVERFHDWSDRRARAFADIFPRDRLLTNIMIYLMNDAFVSSIYYYAAAVTEGVRQMPPGRRVEIPTAFAAFPDPRLPPPPRSFIERGYALTRYTQPPRGGHFAAMEAPDLFVADLRAWARTVD